MVGTHLLTLEGWRLNRPWCEVAPAEILACNLPIANLALYHTATSTPCRSCPGNWPLNGVCSCSSIVVAVIIVQSGILAQATDCMGVLRSDGRQSNPRQGVSDYEPLVSSASKWRIPVWNNPGMIEPIWAESVVNTDWPTSLLYHVDIVTVK